LKLDQLLKKRDRLKSDNMSFDNSNDVNLNIKEKVDFYRKENRMLLREMRLLKDEGVKLRQENKTLDMAIDKLERKV